MPVYVGIDVHRKRSQVAVIDQDGEGLANRNVPNGVEPILGVIGGLPAGTPAASGAAFGWGWLVELLEDYGFSPHLVHPLRCKAIASARLKNDKGRCGDLGSAAARGSAAGGVDRPIVPYAGIAFRGVTARKDTPEAAAWQARRRCAGRRPAGPHHGGGRRTRHRRRCGRAGPAALPVRHGGDGAVGVRPGADVRGGVGERRGRCRAACPDGYQAADGAG